MSAIGSPCLRRREISRVGIALQIILCIPFIFTVLALSGCAGIVSSSSATSNPQPSPASSITTASLPNGQMGIAYSATLAASGGTSPYSWTLSSGTLPSGLTLNSSSGQISGSPSAANTFNFTVQVKDSSATAQTASKSFIVTIVAAGPTPVSISTSSLPNGQVGTAYSATLAASGGTSPYSWTLSSGTLPSGLTLNSSSGQISGSPSTAGTFNFAIQVRDSSNTAQTATKSFGITISSAAPSPVSITTNSLPNGQTGTAYSPTLAATGGKAPYAWTVTAGALPTSLILGTSTGTISGTPSQAGSFSFTVQITDSSSPAQIASKAFSITIAAAAPAPLQVTTTSLPNGQVGSSYSTSLSATGGTTPYAWSVASGSLPAGVTLGASTGQISGSPSLAGNFPILIGVTDSSTPAHAATQSFNVTIAAAGAKTPVTACGTLSNANTTYALQNNISSAGTCITLSASGITLDLNGFTITYDTGNSAAVFGITTSSNAVLNSHITSSVSGGAVVQSTVCKINLATQPNTASGCDHANGISVFGSVEIDHVTIVDYGLDNEAIHTQSGGNVNIHDNTICPYHTLSTLNHFAVYGEIDLTNASGGPAIINNNTIGTACSSVTGQPNGFGYVSIYIAHPSAFSPQLEVTNNQISMASAVRDGYGVEILCVTNSSGPINFEIAHNTINQVSGRGIIVDGENTNTPPGCGTGSVHDNNVTVREAGNEGNGAGDSVGIQARFGASNVQVFNNTVTVPVGQGQCPAQFFTDNGSDCGGIGIKLMATTGVAQNLTATNNTVMATSNSPNFVAAGLYGDFTADPGSYFANNTVSSNSTIVATSPPGGGSGFDGCGNTWMFKNNSFIESANPQGFHTYDAVWFCNPSQVGATDTNNVVFQDNSYQGGASPDDLGVSGGGNPFSYYVKWSLNLTVQNGSGQPLPGVLVSAVATGGGTETVSQVTDSSGNAQLILTDHFASGSSAASPTTVAYTPHAVTVTAAGCKVSASPFQIAMHQSVSQTLVCQ